ncbi:MAG: hypothetical protein FWH03_02705 [Firmicutes bacterium]|nr:hypothetical protein [Bacillota bacterium]
MIKFGLYTIKESAKSKYINIEPQLAYANIHLRPAICLKDKRGQNWLLLATSLDPRKLNFSKKLSRVNALERNEKNLTTKAQMRFSDITGLCKDPKYESVLYFNHAIPVKHQDVKKFKVRGKHIIAQLTQEKLASIEKNFCAYMSRYYNNRVSGFLINYQNNGVDISTFQYNAKAMKFELYKEHFAELQKNKLIRERTAEDKHEQARRKELKRQVRDMLIGEFGKEPGVAAKDAKVLVSAALYELEKESARIAQPSSAAAFAAQPQKTAEPSESASARPQKKTQQKNKEQLKP